MRTQPLESDKKTAVLRNPPTQTDHGPNQTTWSGPNSTKQAVGLGTCAAVSRSQPRGAARTSAVAFDPRPPPPLLPQRRRPPLLSSPLSPRSLRPRRRRLRNPKPRNEFPALGDLWRCISLSNSGNPSLSTCHFPPDSSRLCA